MIISISRRTDIPAFYSDWFFRRVQEGFVLVRNPWNTHQVSRVSLLAGDVDGLVFWSKNPEPMFDRLHLLSDYTYYFQWTVTGYGAEVEKGLPSKRAVVLPAFERLAGLIGPERIRWRYDPIFFSREYTADRHRRVFEALARRLATCTRSCTISFLDFYRNTEKAMDGLGAYLPGPEERARLARDLADIARAQGLKLDACAEMDLESRGIPHAHCIDGNFLGHLKGMPLEVERDKGQRPGCGCSASIDIGVYDTCLHSCRYCYAHTSEQRLRANVSGYDPESPMLVGNVVSGDRITERRDPSSRKRQLRLES